MSGLIYQRSIPGLTFRMFALTRSAGLLLAYCSTQREVDAVTDLFQKIAILELLELLREIHS